MRDLTRKEARAALELVERIRPLLAGHHPAVRGVALAELVAIWLMGHPDLLHRKLVRAHFHAVGAFVGAAPDRPTTLVTRVNGAPAPIDTGRRRRPRRHI